MADYNDWQTSRGPVTPLTSGQDLSTDICPNCLHALGAHSIDFGCHVGWPDEEGCECPLSLAQQYMPNSEAEAWKVVESLAERGGDQG